MTRVPHCAVEGNSGSGKTTTARALAWEWEQPGFVSEYFEYFEPLGLTMPELPPPDEVVGRAQSIVWAVIDQRRYADLSGVRSGTHLAVLDTTVLSVVACEMAKREFGRASAAAEIAAEYRRLLDGGAFWPPDFWVLLETSYDELERRIVARGGSRPFLRQPEVVTYLHAFRASFAERYLSAHECIRLPSDAAATKEVVAAVTAHARSRGSAVTGDGLYRFLDDLACGVSTVP
ncbi:hypothetical protein AB0J82_35070 [Asanoa sp. NPDC049518]|uniref:hypothetical protein n=1 Tax=unclassified Asanoa TaxID=2685164 RepID=UPI00341CB016